MNAAATVNLCPSMKNKRDRHRQSLQGAIDFEMCDGKGRRWCPELLKKDIRIKKKKKLIAEKEPETDEF